MSHSESSLPEYLLIGLHLRYSGRVSLITFISQLWFWVGGLPHLAGGLDLEARWTDDFSGLLPDSLGRWLLLFPIFPGSVPVCPVLASLSIHSTILCAPAFPVYQCQEFWSSQFQEMRFSTDARAEPCIGMPGRSVGNALSVRKGGISIPNSAALPRITAMFEDMG